MIVVDRIEGDRAVVEVDGERVELPASALPPGSREGVVLRLVLDPATEQGRLAEAEARLARLRARSQAKGGGFEL